MLVERLLEQVCRLTGFDEHARLILDFPALWQIAVERGVGGARCNNAFVIKASERYGPGVRVMRCQRLAKSRGERRVEEVHVIPCECGVIGHQPILIRERKSQASGKQFFGIAHAKALQHRRKTGACGGDGAI